MESDRRAEAWKGLPHTHMWQLRTRRDSAAAEAPLTNEGAKPHPGLPSQEHQCWEEKPTKQLAVKVSRDSVCPGETRGKADGDPGVLLKDGSHTLACRHSPWVLAEGEQLGGGG